MEANRDEQARAIAAEWGVSVRLLNDTFWELEEITGNQGELYRYRVRWEEDADPDILRRLGVTPGSFTREVSLEAFDEPDDSAENSTLGESDTDDGVYSINEPLPDISDFTDDEDWNQPGEDEDYNQPGASEDYTKTALRRTDNPPPGEVFLTDHNGNILTDSNGNGLTVKVPEAGPTVSNFGFAEGSGSTFGNGTFGNAAFAPSGFQVGERSAEALHQEVLDRVDRLELLIRAQIDVAPNRGHNHPPQLLEVDRPATQAQLQEVLTAIAGIRSEGSSASPSPQNIVAQASVFQRIASLFRSGPGLVASWVVGGIAGNSAYDALKAHHDEIYTALVGAANAAILWAQHLAAHL
jgi:hypothetical protein